MEAQKEEERESERKHKKIECCEYNGNVTVTLWLMRKCFSTECRDPHSDYVNFHRKKSWRFCAVCTERVCVRDGGREGSGNCGTTTSAEHTM